MLDSPRGPLLLLDNKTDLNTVALTLRFHENNKMKNENNAIVLCERYKNDVKLRIG